MTGVRNATSEIDENSEGNHEEDGSSHDEGLQLANLHDNEAENNTGDNRDKTVKLRDPSRTQDCFAEAYVEHGV